MKKQYGRVESINFDNAILENLDKKNALVIVEDIGWSDIGAWEALKEALEQYPYENIIRGEPILSTSATPLFITMTKKTHSRYRP